MSLNSVTKLFNTAYESDKKVAKRKAQRQQEMFAEFTKAKSKEVLQQRIITMDQPEMSVGDYVDAYYPGWRFVSASSDGQQVKILIEEDPALSKFTYVNKALGMVFGRTQVESGPGLDDERLKVEDPELYNELTAWPEPWASLIYNILIDVTEYSHDAVQKYIDLTFREMENDGVIVKHFKSPSEWTAEQTEKLEKYMVPGRISVRLISPRKATDEDLQ